MLESERHDLESIGVAAGRLRRFAEAIQQGHEFGSGPGVHDEPWSKDFHRVCMVEVYPTTLSWEYIVEIGESFGDCAKLMILNPPPSTDIIEAWALIQRYLTSVSEVVAEAAPDHVELDEPKTASHIKPVTPPVMAFGKLASIVSAKGAAQLAAAGGAVEHACGQENLTPLSDSEQDWLRRMREGDRTVDIALDHGYSERGLYRALSELYERLDADGRTEAVAVATENGWI